MFKFFKRVTILPLSTTPFILSTRLLSAIPLSTRPLNQVDTKKTDLRDFLNDHERNTIFLEKLDILENINNDWENLNDYEIYCKYNLFLIDNLLYDTKEYMLILIKLMKAHDTDPCITKSEREILKNNHSKFVEIHKSIKNRLIELDEL